MVTTHRLRLLSALADGEVAEYAPTVEDGTEEVRYPAAERVLGDAEESPRSALEALADRGVLGREFESKEYRCPDCGGGPLRFTTACESCGSVRTVETDLVVHRDCGHVDEPSAFEDVEERDSCPNCGALVADGDGLDSLRGHVCHDCGEVRKAARHGLRCRDCETVHAPEGAEERVLCRYGFADGGEAWLDEQLRARDLLASSLDSRGFDVRVDAEVGSGSKTRTVAVDAEDDLLAERVVGAVHERPSAAAVRRLVAAADAAGARPVLVSTSGMLGPDAAEAVDTDGVRVLRPEGEGLVSSYETTTEYEAPTVLQRLTSSVTQRL